MIFGWILIGLIIFSLYKRKGYRYEMNMQRKMSSIDRLQERFINGEIDEKTYTYMKNIIVK